MNWCPRCDSEDIEYVLSFPIGSELYCNDCWFSFPNGDEEEGSE